MRSVPAVNRVRASGPESCSGNVVDPTIIQDTWLERGKKIYRRMKKRMREKEEEEKGGEEEAAPLKGELKVGDFLKGEGCLKKNTE